MNKFLSQTYVEIDHRNNEVRLLRDFVYRVDFFDKQTWYVKVLKHFICDLATIPVFIKPIFGKQIGLINKAAIVHDCLYQHKTLYEHFEFFETNIVKKVSREQADAIFYEAMRVAGVGVIRARIIWCSVRVFGRKYWRKK